MMSNNNSEEGMNINICRICLDSNCADMVVLDEPNGWLTLFEHCFGFALTIHDKPREICKTCAENVKRYSKFKDLCLKSSNLWKSRTVDVECSIPDVIIKEEDVLQSSEQDFESTTNEWTNKNESSNMNCDDKSDIIHTDSNFDIVVTEIKVESVDDTQVNEPETTNEEIEANIGNESENNTSVQPNHLEVTTYEENNEAEIENVCQNDSSEMQTEQKGSSEDTNSTKTNIREFHTCGKCKKKYRLKIWYLSHLKVCKASSQETVAKGKKNGVAIAKNESQNKKRIRKRSTSRNQDNNLLNCGLCKYKCTVMDNLRKHLDQHWENNDLSCKLCEFVGDDLGAITVHRYSHFPSKREFLCHICKQVKRSTLSLHFHYRMIHLKTSGGICSQCNKEFNRLKTWKIHLKTHATPGYICDICGKSFAFKYLIKNHLWNHNNKGKHICDVCGKSLKRPGQLKLHIETVHVTTGPVKCTHCNRMFKSQHTLNYHLKTLAREKPYKCQICFKGYPIPTFLKAHMAKHSEERPHACDLCGSRYKAKTQLKVHMRKHTGEMPFKCQGCTKEFATSSQLKVHSTVHTGVRLFSCKLCPRTFNANKVLLRHCARQHKNEMENSDLGTVSNERR